MAEATVNLNEEIRRAISAGDFATAEALLVRAASRDPKHIPTWLNLAATRRQLHNGPGARAALLEVLSMEPRHFRALLMLATLEESELGMHKAAATYAAAIANAPPEQYLDPTTAQALARAREVYGAYAKELDEFILDRIADVRRQCSQAEQRRLERFIADAVRKTRRYQQEPSEYYYPGLPAIEFYEREEFPWLDEFEAATGTIQRELAGILESEQASFTPYIHYPEHMPLDQWRELNHSPRWTAFNFFHRGRPIEERCRRAPGTMQALASLPQPQVPLRSPVAMFSVLQPHTRIPPHTGVANFRLVVHLPLIVPGGCGFRVGGETREWKVGQAWVFDDTIEHEAWNDSDSIRILLICDVWNPRLREEERVAIAQAIAAADAFRGIDPDAQI